jgi:tetratricopeptide (TPR) repeat protein
MMKKILFAYVLSCSSILAVDAQVKKVANVKAPSTSNQHLKVFNLTVASGDVNTAIQALNYYISEQGDNNVYVDTLAMLYMQQGAYAQCYYWADKRLKDKPADNMLLELKGVCLDKLQQPKEAIDIFEKLFATSQNPYHAYKLMELQYGIKRLAECLVTAKAAEKLTYKPEYTMTYSVGQQTGRTYLQAGVYNITALTLYDLDKKTEAKAYFEKALALDSTFLLAKQNIEAMNSLSNPKAIAPVKVPENNNPANKQN